MKYCKRMPQSFLNEELEAWDSKSSAPWIIRQSLSWPRSSPFAESEYYYHIHIEPGCDLGEWSTEEHSTCLINENLFQCIWKRRYVALVVIYLAQSGGGQHHIVADLQPGHSPWCLLNSNTFCLPPPFS